MTDPRTRSPFSGADQLLEPDTIDQVRLAWRLFRDPRVPWIKNAMPAFAALYLFSPIDPIPDFLLGLGQLDDLGVLIAVLIATIRLLPRLAPTDVVAEHLADLRGDSRSSGQASASGGPTYEGRYRIER